MIYSASITTLKSPATPPLMKTIMKVTKGLVYKVEFYFPPGSAGMMGVAVFDGLFQVWPSSVGDFFTGDDVLISFDDLYLKNAAPFQFDVYTYNEDDVFPHEVHVRLGLVSNEVYMARFMPTRRWQHFVELRKQMQKDRDVQAQEQRIKLRESTFALVPGRD